MTLNYQKRKRVGRNTNLNVSKGGMSLSHRTGPLTVNTRGRSSIRLAPGVSWRLGKNATGYVGLAMLALSLAFLVVWACWAVIKLVWLSVYLPTRWAVGKVREMTKSPAQP